MFRSRWLLVVVMVVSLSGPAHVVAAGAADQKSVLLLLPGQPGLPAATALTAGVRSRLVDALSIGVSVETEHIDVAPWSRTDYDRHLREVYRERYLQRFDVIIVAGSEPLQFVVQSRDDLWPGTPVVVCGLDERALGRFTPVPAMGIITIRLDIEGTLRSALALLPDTRHVALIGGSSPSDQYFHDLHRNVIASFGGPLDLIDLTALSLQELLERLASLPEHTVVLLSSFQVDHAGRRIHPPDVIGPISASSNRPLFSVFQPVLGGGGVGGALTDPEVIGREAADLALRAMRGEPMPAVPTRSAARSHPRFDARQLRRFGLDERRLPVGSEVLFKDATIWEQYRGYILSLFVIVLLQACLIIGLFAERRWRRRAQSALAERLGFEKLVAEISATFAALPANRLDEHIRDCLRRVVAFLAVDRGTLWQVSADRLAISATHSWSAEGIGLPPSTIATGDFPVVAGLTQQGRRLVLSLVNALPADAVAERRELERIGVKSLAALPVSIDNRVLGLLVFVSVRAVRSWPEELMNGLQTLADLFANALARKAAAAALEMSEAQTVAVLTALPAEAAIIDASGVILQTSATWGKHVCGDHANAVAAIAPGASYLDACRRGIAIPKDSASMALAVLEAVLRGDRTEAVIEYVCAASGGGDRWLEMRVQRLLSPRMGAAVIHFDVTARKRTEAEARQLLNEIAHMNRVAALAEIASSLAHELNQPLSAVLTNAETALWLLDATPLDIAELRASIEDIVANDQRAAKVIGRMRQFLKKGPVETSPVNLNEVARSVIVLVSKDALLQYVSVEFTPAKELPIVSGDSVQLQQVMLNLLVNAITATAAAPVGRRRVAVSIAGGDAHLELVVRDSGKGVPDTDLERIFQPFFTTKPDGLGMGLAISRSIVVAHGGRMWAENDPAGGALFRVRLPAAYDQGLMA